MFEHTRNLAAMTAMGLLWAATLVGCTQQQQQTVPGDEPTPERESASMWGHYRPQLADGESAVMMAFPTGEVSTSAVLLHQVMPERVRRGQDFEYSYHVTNLTKSELQNVAVMLESSNNLEITSSDPDASRSGSGSVWTLGALGPNETEVITVVANAAEVGTASECVTVSYNNFLCATTMVVEPSLALVKTAPANALLCEPIVLRYVVENTGSGPAVDVVITDTLPVGLVLSDGSREIRIPVGTLPAGESKAYEVRAEAGQTGTFASPAAATGAGGLSATVGQTTTVVTAPAFEITSECGADKFLGQRFTHTYTITNNGSGPANAATASITIPAGATLVGASEGGVEQGGSVVFDLGSVAMEQSRTISVTLTGSDARDYETTATVNAVCAETVADTCSTEISGIPAILLEVVDRPDPVAIGDQTTYYITVTNQGSAPDTNVRIVVELPEEQSLVSATGPTDGQMDGQTYTFAPLGVLGVGEQAVWQVTVRADATGDVRFRTELSSDNLTRPVIETEATNLYE